MSANKWKDYYICKRILKKQGLRIFCEATRFWIIDKEENIIAGGENGMSVNGLLSRSLKLEKEAGGKK